MAPAPDPGSIFGGAGTFIGCMPCRLLARVRVASPYMNICGNSYEFSGGLVW